MQFSLNNNWIELAPSTRKTVDRMGPFAQHALFLKCCQSLYQSQGGQAADTGNPLRHDGFTIERNLIPDEEISELRAMIDRSLDREPDPFVPTSDTPGYNITWQAKDKVRATYILHKAFGSIVKSVIQGFLGSNFLIRSVTGGRLFPSERQTVSYLWHRDSEVAHQVHVILYLTDISPDHGSTSLLPLPDTQAIAQAGYDFPRVEDRKSDLSQECAQAGIEYAPYVVDAKAGDALIFTPNRVLHRGIQPTTGARDALLAVALPSPLPWEVVLQDRYQQTFVSEHHLNIGTDPFAGYTSHWGVERMPIWVTEFKMEPPDWEAGATL